ncbi:hypothetical protein ACJIZ3_015578 [Penstemon smallii]|uniref:BHLH domain-containing protein n=1 Tax=Penstemon smallii TaxID=265156 RepID=A0ABD3RMW4_9LAMI
MEHVGSISEGEWNSFNGMCSEEADFMAQLLGLPNEVPTFWTSHESNAHNAGVDGSSMYSSDEANAHNVYSFSHGRSTYSGDSSILFPTSSHHQSYYPSVPHQFFVANTPNLLSMDYSMMVNKNNSSRIHLLSDNVMEGDDFLNQQDVSNDSMESNENFSEDTLHGKNLQLGREIETPMPETLKEDNIPSEISKKRPRGHGDVPRSKRSIKLKKCPKVDENDEDNNNTAVLHRQSSSSCCSEDDSIASHEMNGVTSSSSGALNLRGKTRAGRGSATDPQSLYARKRRERINERLRILQNLVPNGTKVDISTMLEEAVQYVKFLQLQIKLLSSDDMWMYAPLAYNGMDLGLDLKISAMQKSQS